MSGKDFEKSVFINCPFDKAYEPVLQAILFCVIVVGLKPRIATERNNGAENRLEKIRGLIEGSLYSIHDLSRAQATEKGEFYRLNMPFELGIDYGCRQYFGKGRDQKRMLILEEKPYRYHASISDLAGCDIKTHSGDFQKAIRAVRNWLYSEAKVKADGADKILRQYTDFQGWYYQQQLAQGFSEADIQDYPTIELMDAMIDWVNQGKPLQKS